MQLRAADDVSNSAATQEGTRQEDEARSINHELRQRQTELEARMGRNDETSVGRIQQEARVIDECKGRLATRPLQAGKGGLSVIYKSALTTNFQHQASEDLYKFECVRSL